MPDLLFDTGTVYLNPAILTEDDSSAFVSISDVEQGVRLLFDRRTGEWADTEVYVFTAYYGDGLQTEVRVNVEFGSFDAARAEALYYADVLGRTPTVLREGMDTISIHMGDYDYGGGSGDVLVHTGRTEEYLASGSLDEVMIHELVHVTLDPTYLASSGWTDAQDADDAFVSYYAEDFPDREDLAETFLLYWALRHAPERLTESEIETLEAGIPNRIEFLDSLALELGFAELDLSAANSGTAQNDYVFLEDDGDQSSLLAGNDTAQGGNGRDRINGNNGSDELIGANGADTLNGGNGHDRLLGQQGSDRLTGGKGADTLIGGNGADRLFGSNGADVLNGGAGRDVLKGGNGADRLSGGGGADKLTGGGGNDQLTGNANADVFIFAGTYGHDTITDFNANSNAEKINLSALSDVVGINDLLNNHAQQDGDDVVIETNGGSITLLDVQISDLGAEDFIF